MRVYVLGYAVAACWLTLSRLHRLQSCDSFVFSLASLYEWAPFFWEQDRVGLPLSLLAAPVRDPFSNLLLLTGLMSFAGLLVPLLLARLVCPTRHAYAAVTAGNALLVAVGPAVLHENLFVACNYPLALCLGLVAVRLLDRPTVGRVLIAGGLLLLAHWVYLGVAVFLGPLAGFRWLVRPSRRRFWAAGWVAVLLGLSIGALTLAADEWRRRHPEIVHTPSSKLPLAEWPDCWLGFARGLTSLDGFAGWAGPLAGVAAVGLVAGRRRWQVVAPLWLAAVAEVLLLGTRAWPAMNQHHPRYLLAALTAGSVGAVLLGLLPVLRNRLSPRAAAVASLTLLAGAIGVRYGPPSAAAAPAELLAGAGRDTADILSCGADAYSGEYMAAWPSVWHTNMTLHEAGDPRRLVGVTARAAPWAWRWQAGHLRGGFRLAAPFDQEAQARRWVAHYGLEVTTGPTPHGRLIVFTVHPDPVAPPAPPPLGPPPPADPTPTR